jgi:hypothetical protein
MKKQRWSSKAERERNLYRDQRLPSNKEKLEAGGLDLVDDRRLLDLDHRK